jgi:hypothetical protein
LAVRLVKYNPEIRPHKELVGRPLEIFKYDKDLDEIDD